MKITAKHGSVPAVGIIKRTKLVLGLLIGFSSIAHALIGTQAAPGGEAWTCRVFFFNQKHKPIDLCSGSLISPKEVLLAGHCFDRLRNSSYQAQVSCGYQGILSTPTQYASEPDEKGQVSYFFNRAQFQQSTFEIEKVQIARNYVPAQNGKPAVHDLARIFLKEEMNGIVPVQLASANESWKNQAECQIAGYGMNGEVGLLNHAPLNLNDQCTTDASGVLDIKMNRKKISSLDDSDWAALAAHAPNQVARDQYLRKFVQQAGIGGVGTVGDSGGPLYCRKDSNSKWKLFGVNSASGFSNQGTFLQAVMAWASVSQTEWNDL